MWSQKGQWCPPLQVGCWVVVVEVLPPSPPLVVVEVGGVRPSSLTLPHPGLKVRMVCSVNPTPPFSDSSSSTTPLGGTT